jgi:hypothetical protein
LFGVPLLFRDMTAIQSEGRGSRYTPAAGMSTAVEIDPFSVEVDPLGVHSSAALLAVGLLGSGRRFGKSAA